MDALTRRRAALLGCVALAGVTVTAVFASIADDQWTLGDWYSSIVGLAVFVIGVFLSFGQGDLQRDQKRLQEALGDLELREKITCFYAQGAELERSPDTIERAFGLIGDARAALPVFSHASRELQHEFLQALALNIKYIRSAADDERFASDLASLARRLVDELEKVTCPDDCQEELAKTIQLLVRLAPR